MRRLILLTAVLAASCAPSGPARTVLATEFRFSPDTIRASAPIRLELRNDGTQPHELRVENTHIHIHAAPGKSATGTVRLEPGRYRLLCELTTAGESHASLGMTGTLVVR